MKVKSIAECPPDNISTYFEVNLCYVLHVGAKMTIYLLTLDSIFIMLSDVKNDTSFTYFEIIL